LRGGRLFVKYLNAGHYWGVDKERWLIEAGIGELGVDFQAKKPGLLVTANFDLSAIPENVTFDYVLAQSVFTHLPPAKIQKCLDAVVARLKPWGEFHATWFESKDGEISFGKKHEGRKGELDAVRYPFKHFLKAAREAGATVHKVSNIGHPRKQGMLVFRKRRLVVHEECAAGIVQAAATATR
jgi:hypothetical protein